MKGVILAGGMGTRLLPLTKVTNKHLLPIYNKPMIFYPLNTLVSAGISDIMIVSGREHVGHFIDLLGSGKDYGADFTYKVQDAAGGIAQALGLANEWAGNENIAVILGDNIFENNFHDAFSKFTGGAHIFLKEVKNPARFGVPIFYDDLTIRFIREKPIATTCPYAVTGLYLYDRNVFDYIKELAPSGRGEFEITDVNNKYAANGTLKYAVLDGYWSDAGTFQSMFDASEHICQNDLR